MKALKVFKSFEVFNRLKVFEVFNRLKVFEVFNRAEYVQFLGKRGKD